MSNIHMYSVRFRHGRHGGPTGPTPTRDEEAGENQHRAVPHWPPTRRTRDAVVKRLVETLSGPSVISKRYGVIPYDEATSAEGGGDGDGLDILQVYSEEISKRVLDAAKARSAAGSEQNVNNASASEKMSSVEMES
ncbi:MFP1 attachment factor 1-like [Actinidia eriantha]|uniref:MFP1 attachment factor 1-like n=1 Tax=Actinidia eriantha TaxID=165200 RepID=UPI002589C0DA|nr:MFP1 attachment factor 1-like [Actinidia eriantha]